MEMATTTKMTETSRAMFETLKGELMNLVVKPGEAVSEAATCERFGVTRPTTRLVFQRLCDLGLLEVKPYKGARATLLDLGVVCQIIFFRTTIETQLVHDFMDSRPDPYTLESMEHNLRLQEICTNSHPVDEKRFFQLDSAFHQFWYDAMHCSSLWDFVQKDLTYWRFRMLDFVGTGKYPDIVGDHVRLFSAIKSGAKDEVRPILGRHLNNGLKRMGYLIQTDYRQYFTHADEASYWSCYNLRFKES